MKEFFIILALIGIALFLILLVLVQRGRGGGLAGALGGAGGQSAFGAKAGDTFTKITMWTAFIWIVFCIVAVRLLSGSSEPAAPELLGGMGTGAETVGEDKSATPPATTDGSEKSAPGKTAPEKTGPGKTGPPDTSLPSNPNPAPGGGTGRDDSTRGK